MKQTQSRRKEVSNIVAQNQLTAKTLELHVKVEAIVEVLHEAIQSGTIELCHYPPGTSKWNKIEHRLFCHITRNWQGVPLETMEILVNLINSTQTKKCLGSSCLVRRAGPPKGKNRI